MGDPAGIGPEIIVKALADDAIYRFCRPVILGDPNSLYSTVKDMAYGTSLEIISHPSKAGTAPGTIYLLPLSSLNNRSIQPGKPSVEGGRAMVEYIIRAVEMTIKNDLGAMVTCPINKALMHRAGYHYDGHTQLISSLTNTDDFVMMLAGERLRVALVTIHCPLRDVPGILDTRMILKTIIITAKSLQNDLGIASPRLAVAALNPHAGESGLFGMEEEEIIKPSVKMARDKGLNVVGPFPSDTLFHKAASGKFEAVVAMYHDQGLIPLKLLHFSDAVNITLGLPIIRASVDHGTAYDIAGTGQADPSSLKSAIKMAAAMVKCRAKKVRL